MIIILFVSAIYSSVVSAFFNKDIFQFEIEFKMSRTTQSFDDNNCFLIQKKCIYSYLTYIQPDVMIEFGFYYLEIQNFTWKKQFFFKFLIIFVDEKSDFEKQKQIQKRNILTLSEASSI